MELEGPIYRHDVILVQAHRLAGANVFGNKCFNVITACQKGIKVFCPAFVPPALTFGPSQRQCTGIDRSQDVEQSLIASVTVKYNVSEVTFLDLLMQVGRDV